MDHAELIAAVLGFVSAILGVVTALINRNRIVESRHATGSRSSSATRAPVTLGKRFKRFCICVGLAFLLMMTIGSLVGPGPPYDRTSETWAMILLSPFLFLCLMAAYQLIAMVIVLFARLWR
jgi:hypothetical protein